MNHDYETRVALSDSVNNTCVKWPLAEKSRLRHIRLAIKPRYLRNHASQIKSYYETLSENRGRSFRIRHKKSPEALPSGEITMTSYPPCNKTSLSRKPCIPDKSYYRTPSGSHGRSIRIRQNKSPVAPPSGEITMTSYPVGNETSLSRKPCIPDEKIYWRTLSGNNGHFIRIRHENALEKRPSGANMITSYPVGNETSLSWKPCIPDKKLL